MTTVLVDKRLDGLSRTAFLNLNDPRECAKSLAVNNVQRTRACCKPEVEIQTRLSCKRSAQFQKVTTQVDTRRVFLVIWNEWNAILYLHHSIILFIRGNQLKFEQDCLKRNHNSKQFSSTAQHLNSYIF